MRLYVKFFASFSFMPHENMQLDAQLKCRFSSVNEVLNISMSIHFKLIILTNKHYKSIRCESFSFFQQFIQSSLKQNT